MRFISFSDKTLEWIKIILFSVTGMLLAVSLLNTTRITAGPFEILLSLTPFRQGNTVINLPPVGEIKAFTHWFFFQLDITLLNVDIDVLSGSAHELKNMETWIEELMWGARKGIIMFGLQCLLATFAGGAILTHLFCLPKVSHRFWKGGGIAVLCFILIIGITVAIPFDIAAFDSPRYYGILSAAPWAMNFFDMGIAAVESLSEQLITMTTNLFYLFEQMEQLSPVETVSSLKVLHVSDIHNNPAAVDFVEKVVNVFNIDMVIDTGDITDYGTPLEGELVSGVADLPVPYVLVPGNHDAPPVTEILRDNGVLVLENEIADVEGITIAGIADPAYYNDEITTTAEDLKEYAKSLKYIFEESGENPDILAVHDPVIGNVLKEKVPVILSGHSHRVEIRQTEENVFVNPGTTGASGIRGLNNIDDTSYSMFLMYYNEDEEGGFSLSAGDLINVPKATGGFKLERYLFE